MPRAQRFSGSLRTGIAFRDLHRRADPDLLEQLHQVSVAHAHTPPGAGPAQRHLVRRAVDVDVAAHGVHLPKPVEPGLAAGQPEDPGEYPVPPGVLRPQLWRVDLSGGAAPDEHGVGRLPGPDLRPDDVPATRRTVAAVLLPRPVGGRGDGIAPDQPTRIVQQIERLRRDADPNPRHPCPPSGAPRKTGSTAPRIPPPAPLGAALLVLGRGLGLDHILERTIGIAADVAYCDARAFGFVAHHLDQVAAAFFRQCGHRHPDDVAVSRRIQAEIAVAYRLFDLADHVVFVRLHAEGSGVDQRDTGHLRHRSRATVVVDHHVIENTGVGASGAYLRQIVLQRLQRLAHLLFGGLLDLNDAGFSHLSSL